MSKKSLRAMPNYAAPSSAYRFSARLFHATAMFIAKRDIRYYLNGVLFMPHPSGGAMIAATNGHQMCVAYDPTGAAPADRIVSVCPALEAAAGRFHEGWVHMDEALDSRVIVSSKSGVESYVQPGKALIEGKYPNVFRVMPSDPSKLQPAVSGAVNALYMEAIGTMTKRLRLRITALYQWQMDENSVIVSRLEGEPNIVLLTMPMTSKRPDIVNAMTTFKPMPVKTPEPEPVPVAAVEPVAEPAPAVPEPVPAPVEAPAAEPDSVQVAIQALQAAATALTALTALSAKTKTLEPA